MTDDEAAKALSKEIRRMRLSSGNMSCRTLARRVDCSSATIINIENRKLKPSMKLIDNIRYELKGTATSGFWAAYYNHRGWPDDRWLV